MRCLPLLLLCACGAADERIEDPFDQPRPSAERPSAERPPAASCAGLECLPCSRGEACAPEPHIEGTCCGEGDPLVRLGSGRAPEAVDLHSDGHYAIACGGFGATIHVLEEGQPRGLGQATQRCQHAVTGPELDGGTIAFFAHHGDSWAGAARLSTFHLSEQGVVRVHGMVEEGVLYEGLAYRDGHLYVAAHQGGLRIYALAADGHPEFLTALPELGNAWKVELSGELAYVVDNDFGLHVVSIADPATPRLLGSVPTSGQPRDLAVGAEALYVALGSSGVDIFDASTPEAPTPKAQLVTLGSAQSVALSGEVLAVAAWNHVAVYDAATTHLLGTQQTRARGDFEQDLGVAMVGNTVLVAEWEGLHSFEFRPGYAAPDLWVDEDLYSFEAETAGARAIVVRNVGHRPLDLSLEVSEAALEVSPSSLEVAPGGSGVAELVYTPPGGGLATLSLKSNDPDEPESRLLVSTAGSDRLAVGDRLTDDFAFLDPSGANQLQALEGQVIVLAYFALF